ncbi:MAG: FKBP-type peptidyl-prolyl cis-trans isomerase [Clostridia bacterium]|nr:FKBP-type peptidyl-prolyl cis-trans isomerase [Clostridia bacterium]
MKRIISILFCVLMVLTLFTACGNEGEQSGENSRILFNINLEKYIKLGEYKNVTVDTSSDKFKEYYDDVIESDISENDLYKKKTEGTVAEGDVANIDYVGKKDGVAFEGGTANGYDLEIGSNSFIDGFEEGLVGVKIGETVDLNLTFPEGYQSAELAGKAVVFTVKVNYVKSEEGLSPEEYYKDLGYKSLEEYKESVKKSAVEVYLMENAQEKAEVKDYPKVERNRFYKDYKASAESNISSNYNMSFADYLKNVGQTETEFKNKALEEQIDPMLEQLMLVYAIADAEDIVIDKKAVDKQVNKIVEQYNQENITADYINDYYIKNYGDYYLEYITAYENVIDFLYENATIK